MKEMRLKKRAMPAEAAYDCLKNCGHAVLCMVEEDGTPYGVPISPAVEGMTLYFHSALVGEKMEAMAFQPQVCITAVGSRRTLVERYTEEYTSVIARGRVRVTEGEECRHGLELITRKYCGERMDLFEGHLEKYKDAVRVCAVDLTSITGKQH